MHLKWMIPTTLLLLACVTLSASAQTAADAAAIKEVVLDYVDGWWTGDAQRMARALHPDRVKRNIYTNEATGHSMMNSVTKYDMVEYSRAGGGSERPDEKGDIQVLILAVHRDIAKLLAMSTTSNWLDGTTGG